MSGAATPRRSRARSIHRWVRRGFLVWAVVASAWMANTVRTRGVAEELLRSSPEVKVVERTATLEFLPTDRRGDSALIFLCGAGIHAHAYAPLLRPIADAGRPVFVVKLPYRFAPLPSHKDEAVRRVDRLISAHSEIERWVIAGHSLGGALAARVARGRPDLDAAYVLIGTTHPKDHDLSGLEAPFTKVYASNDGVAPPDRVLANRALLPEHTRWIRIDGGNHSQFGHYGHQLLDGRATIGRETQQAITREALFAALETDGTR